MRLLAVLGSPAVEMLATHFDIAVDEAEAIGRVYEDHFDEWYLPRIVALPDAETLLAALHGYGVRLGVVTNKLEALGGAVVHRLGWDGWFDVVVGADIAAFPKPHADPVLHALRGVGCSPDRAAFVGDTETDMHCGQAAGLSLVIGLTTNRDAATLQTAGATYACDTLAQVAVVLLPGLLPGNAQEILGQA